QARELRLATVDATPLQVHFAAVGEGVLDGIGIEVLIDVVAAEMPAAGRLSTDREGILHPAAFIDVVNVEIAVASARGPEERVEALDLIHQVADALGLALGAEERDGAVHAVGAEQEQVAHLPVADPLKELFAGVAVPAHEADADFEVMPLGLLVQG